MNKTYPFSVDANPSVVFEIKSCLIEGGITYVWRFRHKALWLYTSNNDGFVVNIIASKDEATVTITNEGKQAQELKDFKVFGNRYYTNEQNH